MKMKRKYSSESRMEAMDDSDTSSVESLSEKRNKHYFLDEDDNEDNIEDDDNVDDNEESDNGVDIEDDDYEDDISSNESNDNDSMKYNNKEENNHTNNILHLSLQERLLLQQQKEEFHSFHNISKKKTNKIIKHKIYKEKVKKQKNEPAIFKSNRPVPILRDSSNIQSKQFIDPRFSDATGKLNHIKFLKNYSFLNDNQNMEIQQLTTSLKKTKNENSKQYLKNELSKHKQQLIERKRALQVDKRLKQVYMKENEKIQNGKKPYFLKKSDIKSIVLDERYKELKKDGKLNKFLAKKRKHNASKDRTLLPSRREE